MYTLYASKSALSSLLSTARHSFPVSVLPDVDCPNCGHNNNTMPYVPGVPPEPSPKLLASPLSYQPMLVMTKVRLCPDSSDCTLCPVVYPVQCHVGWPCAPRKYKRAKPAPLTDLTTEGIEPNPGPSFISYLFPYQHPPIDLTIYGVEPNPGPVSDDFEVVGLSSAISESTVTPTELRSDRSNIANVENKLHNVLGSHGLSSAARDWLVGTLDPNHDLQLPNYKGPPDSTGQNSVIQTYRQTKTLSCPTGVTAGTWDCQVVMDNTLTNCWRQYGYEFYQYTQPGLTTDVEKLFVNDPNQSFTPATGGLTVYRGATGSNPWAFPMPVANTSNIYDTIAVPGTLIDGTYRVVAQAYEVRSVGPKLYRSGMSYSWRIPTPSRDNTEMINWSSANAAGVFTAPLDLLVYRNDKPPSTAAEAIAIPTTTTLMAEQGVYVVSKYNKTQPASQQDIVRSRVWECPNALPYLGTFISSSPIAYRPVYCSGRTPSVTIVAGTAPTNNLQGFATATQIEDFDICGTIFTGLSLQDVLEVTVIWKIQRFPTQVQTDLVLLAQPSPPLDLLAYELYSKAAATLPTGVPVDWNSFGDWFRTVAADLASAAGPAISKLPGVGKVVGPALTLAGNFIRPNKKAAKNKSIHPKIKNLELVEMSPSTTTSKVSKDMKRVRKAEGKLKRDLVKTK